MNAQQRHLLQTIQQNYNNEQCININSNINISSGSTNLSTRSLYMSTNHTAQQIFLQKLINLYVLRKKQYPKLTHSRISFLLTSSLSSGGFLNLLLKIKYMAYCMENKIQEEYQNFNILKILTKWVDVNQSIMKEINKNKEKNKDMNQNVMKINLFQKIFAVVVPESNALSSVEEMIVYLNYIAVDIMKIINSYVTDRQIKQSKQQQQQKTQHQPQDQPSVTITPPCSAHNKASYPHISPQQLINLLNFILPKTLFNIIIPQNLLINSPLSSPRQFQQKSHDFLFSNQSYEYFCKQKKYYQQLIKQLINILIEQKQLNQSDQKVLMQIGFKYFYLFNRNKYLEPFSMFIKIYEKVTDAVKFALSDQFLLFFKIINKLGYNKFIIFLRQKFPFIQTLLNKINPQTIIGNLKDTLNPFQNNFLISQHIYIPPGSSIIKCFQVFCRYSLIYFSFLIKSHDISIKLYFLGDFSQQQQKRTLLINKQKIQVQFKGNVIALEKGIYMFEVDNTYSWLKGKNVVYQCVVMKALDIKNRKINQNNNNNQNNNQNNQDNQNNQNNNNNNNNNNEEDKFIPVLFNKYDMNYCIQSNIIDINKIKYAQYNQINNSNHNMNMINNINHNNTNHINTSSNVNINSVIEQKKTITISYNMQKNTYKLIKKSYYPSSSSFPSSYHIKQYQYQTDNRNVFLMKISELYNNKQQSSEWSIQNIKQNDNNIKVLNMQTIKQWVQNCINTTRLQCNGNQEELQIKLEKKQLIQQKLQQKQQENKQQQLKQLKQLKQKKQNQKIQPQQQQQQNNNLNVNVQIVQHNNYHNNQNNNQKNDTNYQNNYQNNHQNNHQNNDTDKNKQLQLNKQIKQIKQTKQITQQ